MSRKVLITGARSKFVPELVRLLRNNQDNIALLTKASDLDFGSDLSYFKCDLTKEILIDYSPDVVIHLAASVPYNSDNIGKANSHEIVRDNLLSFVNVAKFSVLKGVRKIVFISSTDVYPILNEEVITEDTQVNPGNFYGCSKLACERIGFAFSNLSDLSLSILRLGPVYGEGMEKNLKIGTFIDEVRKGNEVNLYNANNILSLLPIKSASDAIFKAIDAPSGLYNIAGSPLTLDQFIRQAFKYYEFEPRISYSSQQDISCRLVFDLSRAKNLLGWCPIAEFCF